MMIRLLLLSALFCLMVVQPTEAQNFSLSPVVDSNTAIPGGTHTFRTFSSVSLHGSRVAFHGGAGGGIESGIYVSDGQTVTRIAGKDTPIPKGEGTFTTVFDPVFDGNIVAFHAYGPPEDGVSQEGLYWTVNGLSVIADRETPIPVNTGVFIGFPTSDTMAIDNGSIVFKGFGEFGQSGIYTTDPALGDGTNSAGLSAVAPWNPPSFTRYGSPDIDNGNVSYIAGNLESEGVYAVLSGSSVNHLVADFNTAIPGGSGNFSRFRETAIDGENVAFLGSGNRVSGVYTSIDRALAVVADSSTSIPERGGTFDGFSDLEFDAGRVTFKGIHELNDAGIYTNLSGELTKVIATGDLLDGKTVDRVYSPSMDGGDIAFRVEFTDDSEAIYLASYAPSDVGTLLDVGGLLTGSYLGGTELLGGVDVALAGTGGGTSFTTNFSISNDPNELLASGVQLGTTSAFQVWSFETDAVFDSALLTLNYNPLLLEGDLRVFHRFNGQALELTLGTLNALNDGEYAIAGDGLLQVRVPHFSDILVTGTPSGSVAPVPEPSSLVLLLSGGLIGAVGLSRCRLRRPVRVGPAIADVDHPSHF